MGGVVNFTEGRPFGAAGKVDLLKGESQAGGVANRKIIRAIVSNRDRNCALREVSEKIGARQKNQGSTK